MTRHLTCMTSEGDNRSFKLNSGGRMEEGFLFYGRGLVLEMLEKLFQNLFPSSLYAPRRATSSLHFTGFPKPVGEQRVALTKRRVVWRQNKRVAWMWEDVHSSNNLV
jgi:hypothetical protein